MEAPAMSKPSARHAAAFTLIELLVVLTVTSVMMAMTALTLGMLFRTERNVRLEAMHAQAMSRLADHLRRDAHLATNVVAEEDVLRFLVPTGVIEYQRQPRRIVRSVQRDGVQQHLELFPLAEQATSTWAVSSEAPAVVRVAIGQPNDQRSAPHGSARHKVILAVVGLHRSTSP